MTDINIDKLEPGPELDALVAEKVMGWHLEPDTAYGHTVEQCIRENRYYWADSEGEYITHGLEWDCSFSTDIAAVWKIFDALKWPKFWSRLTQTDTGNWRCDIDLNGGDGPARSASAPTAPLAICRASLKAVEAT